ncbi:PREDICTED: uncharacterized protein LOC109153241 isoform X2 [Ipomoea nil]|uniref:uncharacterized protein LOC109153241 isoform X2 n=1 Tax=Ipomoea nil TaxID=35883 RepID=UPI0009018CC0|nr:PREDICTED: uncharacterized protein LOC109153241 isoform X2 [Ipomoea nil]
MPENHHQLSLLIIISSAACVATMAYPWSSSDANFVNSDLNIGLYVCMYCSNLYPKAESYGVCNWCLTVEKGEEAQNSSNSSSSCRNSGEENDGKARKKFGPGNIRMGGSCLRLKNAPPKLQVKNRPVVSKQKSVSPESSPAAVKGVAAAAGRGGIEERLRRTKSDSGIVRHVFRNKVRRYKLLDEVSSQ